MPERQTLGDALAADAIEAAKFAAAMQFPKRLVDVVEPILLAAAKKHGRGTVLKAKAAIAFLRTDMGQTALMGVAGVGLMYLPATSPTRAVLREQIAPIMRQLAMGRGLDKLLDEIANPLLAAVEKIGESIVAGAEAAAQIEATAAPSGVRVDAGAPPSPQAAELGRDGARAAARGAG
jgi:hypothetical protein